MKHKLFRGKNAIITGGSSGIGRATGKQLLKQGLASLALIDDADPNDVCAQLRREFPHKHIIFVAADLSMRQTCRQAFGQVRSQFGDDTIELVIGCNNRGVSSESLLTTTRIMPPVDQRKVANNLVGVVNGVRGTVVRMIQSINVTYEAIDAMSITAGGRGGCIAHISPISSIHDITRVPPFFATTSHAIVGLMRSLAHDHFHLKHGISFITFCPTMSSKFANESQIIHTPHVVPKQQRIVIVENVQKLATIRFENIGRLLVQALVTGKNSSVWMVQNDDDELHELILPSPQLVISSKK